MSVPTGAYGLILPPQSIQGIDPAHVTKVFHTKKAYDAFLTKMDMIRAIFQGDPYYLAYPFDHVPTLKNVPDQYRHLVSRQFIRNATRNKKVEPHDQPIYAVHMPHLGVDLTHLPSILGRLRSIPVPIMLTHMYELLEKVAMLWNHGYIHGDVRTPNIMIQPETGKLTLIDFDWLMDVREFADKYRPVTERDVPGASIGKTKKELITTPHITPELLLSDISQHLDETDFSTDKTNIDSSRTTRIITDYSTQLLENFSYMKAYYQLHELTQMIHTAMKDSITTWKKVVTEGGLPIMESYRTLDGYGIGQNLLELCHQLYPGSLTYAADPSMTLHEKSALNTMIHYVLKPMCALSLRNRKHVSEVLGIASEIIASFQQAPANEKPANNVANGAPTNQGNKQGGTRRSKRKTRRHNIARR